MTPGRYTLTLPCYSLPVEVRHEAGEWVAIPPSGWSIPLRTVPDAILTPTEEGGES